MLFLYQYMHITSKICKMIIIYSKIEFIMNYTIFGKKQDSRIITYT